MKEGKWPLAENMAELLYSAVIEDLIYPPTYSDPAVMPPSHNTTITEESNNKNQNRRQPRFADEDMLMKQRRFVWRMTRAIKKTKRPKQTNQDADIDECVVCILPLELPVRLQCGHVFCFTCARGLLKTTKCCALCRAAISMELATNYKMFLVGTLPKPTTKYSWFYKSRKGWWLFAPRMQTDIENAFKSGKESMMTILNGQIYIFDFRKMVQTFRNSSWEAAHCQRIKKDLSSSSHLGVAGLEYCKLL
ncbi:Hypothetical predicted protein [Cloeon dipterum]|uniref:E3 ubiquitin-protein ligase n=1 Tax=Cloeon dipterum TaxID=197152 RepID=A0A8S1DYU7_9INSE|nr:Hypothetical predicted protein [Cloeon dipterum]